MSNFDYGGYDRRDMSAEEISKTINKKITIFGVRTDELTWAFYRSMPIFFGIIIVAFIIHILALFAEFYYLKVISMNIAKLSAPVLVLSTFLHVRVVKKLNRRFGDGTALLALSTTGFLTILFNPKAARKNYGFNISPNNNFQRIE